MMVSSWVERLASDTDLVCLGGASSRIAFLRRAGRAGEAAGRSQTDRRDALTGGRDGLDVLACWKSDSVGGQQVAVQGEGGDGCRLIAQWG